MVVQSDSFGKCDGCSTTVQRVVTYQVINASGANSGAIPICESPTVTNWSCTQQQKVTFQSCSSPYTTTSTGAFPDQWTMGSDAYTPAGCGFSVTDHWQWAASASVQKTFATLTGYVHTNAISINGHVSPPAGTLPPGTVINP